MTYNVFSGTLNLNQSINQSTCGVNCWQTNRTCAILKPTGTSGQCVWPFTPKDRQQRTTVIQTIVGPLLSACDKLLTSIAVYKCSLFCITIKY